MKAVQALRAELEEEEQALGGDQAASVSEDAQSDEVSSRAESDSAQQAAAVDAGDAGSDSDQDHASPPDLTCKLTIQAMYTIQTMLHGLKDPAANIPQHCNVMQSYVHQHVWNSIQH